MSHLPCFDTVITMSEHDRQTLLRWLPALRTAVIPNGVDCEYFRDLPAGQPGQRIVFVGNFKHPLSVDAALFFAREAWPLVRARFPAARFVVLGTNPPAELTALAECPHCHYHLETLSITWDDALKIGWITKCATCGRHQPKLGAHIGDRCHFCGAEFSSKNIEWI